MGHGKDKTRIQLLEGAARELAQGEEDRERQDAHEGEDFVRPGEAGRGDLAD